MQEADVLSHVAAHFQDQGYRVWYNPRGLGSLNLASHQVTVAGHYPDLLGVGVADHIVAVETKGSDGDLAKGLGQALIYKQGAHQSFIAAPTENLRGYIETALAHGIGVLPVGGRGVEGVHLPPLGTQARFLKDVQRELAILSARGDQTRRIASSALYLNNPLHYLIPVLLFDGRSQRSDVAAALQSGHGWGLGAGIVAAPIAGAKILGLLEETNGVLAVTHKGRLVQQMVQVAAPRTLIPDLRKLTKSRRLIDDHPLLGGILRFLYLEDPDIRQLHAHLSSYRGRISLRELLRSLLQDSPNIVLNVFCKRPAKSILLEHLTQGTEEEALSPAEISKWFMHRSCFQLKRQLIHVGILADHPATGGQGADKLDLDRDIWELNW